MPEVTVRDAGFFRAPKGLPTLAIDSEMVCVVPREPTKFAGKSCGDLMRSKQRTAESGA
jgi:hypothetical protein